MIISRPATLSDAKQIAELLVQLYEVEAPGMIGTDRDGCVGLLARAIRKNGSVLKNSRVLSDFGNVIGFGSVATRARPRPDVRYPGLEDDARTLLGGDAEAFCRGLWQLLDAVLAPPAEDEAQLHSIVVDRTYRGSSIGSRLLRELENIAVGMGKRTAMLYVVNGNTAELFYKRHGYSTRANTTAPDGYISIVMKRELETSTSVANPARVRA